MKGSEIDGIWYLWNWSKGGTKHIKIDWKLDLEAIIAKLFNDKAKKESNQRPNLKLYRLKDFSQN